MLGAMKQVYRGRKVTAVEIERTSCGKAGTVVQVALELPRPTSDLQWCVTCMHETVRYARLKGCKKAV